MFKEQVKELCNLCVEVSYETDAYAYVYCSISPHGLRCSIGIQDNGFRKESGYDGRYDIFEKEILAEESQKAYEAAKAHLTRLLEERTKKDG